MRCTQRACKRKGLQPSAFCKRNAFSLLQASKRVSATMHSKGPWPFSSRERGPLAFFLKQGFPQERGIPQCSLSGEKGLRERVPLCALREKREGKCLKSGERGKLRERRSVFFLPSFFLLCKCKRSAFSQKEGERIRERRAFLPSFLPSFLKERPSFFQPFSPDREH